MDEWITTTFAYTITRVWYTVYQLPWAGTYSEFLGEVQHWRRLGADFRGDGTNFVSQIFEWLLGKNFHFTSQNFRQLFLVIDSILSVFCCLFSVSTVWNLIYNIFDPLFLTKNLFQKILILDTFFSQFVLCLTSENSTSQNIGGTDACAVPPPQIVGDHPPVPSKSPPMGSCNEIEIEVEVRGGLNKIWASFVHFRLYFRGIANILRDLMIAIK